MMINWLRHVAATKSYFYLTKYPLRVTEVPQHVWFKPILSIKLIFNFFHWLESTSLRCQITFEITGIDLYALKPKFDKRKKWAAPFSLPPWLKHSLS